MESSLMTDFIKQQQEESKEYLAFIHDYLLSELDKRDLESWIENHTAQIIKNTCELVRKNLLDHAYNTERGYLVPSEVEDIINKLPNTITMNDIETDQEKLTSFVIDKYKEGYEQGRKEERERIKEMVQEIDGRMYFDQERLREYIKDTPTEPLQD